MRMARRSPSTSLRDRRSLAIFSSPQSRRCRAVMVRLAIKNGNGDKVLPPYGAGDKLFVTD